MVMIDDSHLNITPTKPADYICYFVSQGNIKSKDEENVPVILLTFHFDDNLIFHGTGGGGQARTENTKRVTRTVSPIRL